MKPKCRHNSGWWTKDAVVVVSTNGHVRISNVSSVGRQHQKVVLKCNSIECEYRRHAYFDETGLLVTLSRPYRPTQATDQERGDE